MSCLGPVTAWRTPAAVRPTPGARVPSLVRVSHLGLGKTVKVGELSYEGLELLNAKEAVVCAVKLTRAARGAAAAAANN